MKMADIVVLSMVEMADMVVVVEMEYIVVVSEDVRCGGCRLKMW